MAEWHEAGKAILLALYRYQVMSPKQLAVLLGYRTTSIHRIGAHLMRREMIRSVKLPFLVGNAVGYVLRPAGAKEAACGDGDSRMISVRISGQTPIQLEHSYGANAFFIRSIKESLSRRNEGWAEWLGPRDAAERYARFGDKGKKQMPLRPDGMGTYRLADGQRLILHLEYDTGSESLWRVQDKMWNYGTILPGVWQQPEQVNVLILTRGVLRVRRLMQLWQSLRQGPLAGQACPAVWCEDEKEWQTKGHECLWLGEAGNSVSLRQMPKLPPLRQVTPVFLGKQSRPDLFGKVWG